MWTLARNIYACQVISAFDSLTVRTAYYLTNYSLQLVVILTLTFDSNLGKVEEAVAPVRVSASASRIVVTAGARRGTMCFVAKHRDRHKDA